MYFIFIRRSRRRRRYDLLTFICGFRSCTFSTTILLLITIDFRLIMSSFHSLFLSISQDGRLNIIYALCECVVRTDDLSFRHTCRRVGGRFVTTTTQQQHTKQKQRRMLCIFSSSSFIVVRCIHIHTTHTDTHIIAHTHTHTQTPHLLTSSRCMAHKYVNEACFHSFTLI